MIQNKKLIYKTGTFDREEWYEDIDSTIIVKSKWDVRVQKYIVQTIYRKPFNHSGYYLGTNTYCL